MAKSRIDDLLESKPQGMIKRGKGVQLSTEVQNQRIPVESALVHKSTHAPLPMQKNIRPSKGYKIRTDVAQECKILAAEKHRPLYEIMEEALIAYLQKNGRNIR
jgi:hypothetical protein